MKEINIKVKTLQTKTCDSDTKWLAIFGQVVGEGPTESEAMYDIIKELGKKHPKTLVGKF
ncbi:hypothetical protein [Vibrio sp. RE88]|uniref:hypothetical protein n=1 Tax=Vibrio sp. RE88 TaxID=2607610 RepID=UPI0014934C46|nr:hypothetical protein [Vibrio sp. RE88]NOH62790.1 hypothetical protein [Vibrio sp. RE88]